MTELPAPTRPALRVINIDAFEVQASVQSSTSTLLLAWQPHATAGRLLAALPQLQRRCQMS